MLKLTFDKKWIDEYWLEISPRVISSIKSFEEKEHWIATDENGAIEELNRIAAQLPAIANQPINEDVEAYAYQLISVLGYLPLKTAIAAFGWLGALSENEHKWNYIINVIAHKVVASNQNKELDNYKLSKILTSRIELFSFLVEFEKHFISDTAMRLSLQTHQKNTG